MLVNQDLQDSLGLKGNQDALDSLDSPVSLANLALQGHLAFLPKHQASVKSCRRWVQAWTA